MKQAVFLLAGGGIRLKPYTNDIPKCLVEVNGKPLLIRMLEYLVKGGIEKAILVVGYKGDMIKDVVGTSWKSMVIEYVENKDWATTNNVVSMNLAVPRITEDFILLEGDLIFTWEPFNQLFEPDRIAVSRYLPHMSGTVVYLGNNSIVSKFILDKNLSVESKQQFFKTVNIYSFNHKSFQNMVVPQLEKLIETGQKQVYYEQAIANAVADSKYKLTAVNFAGTPWYEIDTEEDLLRAEELFKDTEV